MSQYVGCEASPASPAPPVKTLERSGKGSLYFMLLNTWSNLAGKEKTIKQLFGNMCLKLDLIIYKLGCNLLKCLLLLLLCLSAVK